jgi:hypothetical protein
VDFGAVESGLVVDTLGFAITGFGLSWFKFASLPVGASGEGINAVVFVFGTMDSGRRAAG